MPQYEIRQMPSHRVYSSEQMDFAKEFQRALYREIEARPDDFFRSEGRGGNDIFLQANRIVPRIITHSLMCLPDGRIMAEDINRWLPDLPKKYKANWCNFVNKKVEEFNRSQQPKYEQKQGRVVTDLESLAAAPTIDAKIERLHFFIHEALRRPEYESITQYERKIKKCLNSRYSLNISQDGAPIQVKDNLLDELLKNVGSKAAPQVLLLLEEFKLISVPDARGAYVRNFGDIKPEIHTANNKVVDGVGSPGKQLSSSDVTTYEGLPGQLRLPEHVSAAVFGREEALEGNYRWRRDPDAFDSGDEDPQATPWSERVVGAGNRSRGPRSLFDRSVAGSQIDPDRLFGL